MPYIILKKTWYSYTAIPILTKHSIEPSQENWLSNEKNPSKSVQPFESYDATNRYTSTSNLKHPLFTSAVKNYFKGIYCCQFPFMLFQVISYCIINSSADTQFQDSFTILFKQTMNEKNL